MGKLVDLTKKARRIRPRVDMATAGGEVLIFTGVRYQRDETVTPEKPAGAPASGSKRRRG